MNESMYRARREEGRERASMLKLDLVMNSVCVRVLWIEQRVVKNNTTSNYSALDSKLYKHHPNYINFKTIKYDEQNLFQIISVICVYVSVRASAYVCVCSINTLNVCDDTIN